MPGWTPLDSDSWPALRSALVTPWPVEAARFDLRWEAERVRLGESKRITGRPTLCTRWGWSDRKARSLMSTPGEWQDPANPAPDRPNVQRMSSERPAGVQPVSSGGKGEPEQSPGNVQPVSSERPAGVQQMSTRAFEYTDHRSPTPTPVSEISVLLDRWSSLKADRGIRGSNTPTGKSLSTIKTRLKQLGLSGCLQVLDWIEHAPDFGALVLRGEAPNSKRRNEFLRVSTVFNSKMGGRLEAAEGWESAGKPTGTGTGNGNNGRRSIDQVFGDIEAEFNTPPAEYAEYEEVEQHGDA